MKRLYWSGGDRPYLGGPSVDAVGPVSVGRYGGIGGKNEDGALVWSGGDWTFAVVLDSHAGSASVEAVLGLFGEAGSVLPLQQELMRLVTAEDTTRRMS
ncbi:MAG: hypothetical protein EON57_07310, partial [Alphaproteobacteria bacterium]